MAAARVVPPRRLPAMAWGGSTHLRAMALAGRRRLTKGRHRCLFVQAQAGGGARPPLVVVGSANADLVLSVSRLPLAGETLAASDLQTFPGGKGANQASAAGRLAYPTLFVGQLGNDANAGILRDSLGSCGVDCSALSVVDAPTGTAVILLQPSGENSIVIVGGANQAGWALTEIAKTAIAGAGMVLLQREIPEAVNIEVAKIAQAAGVPVVLDVGGQEGEISPELLARLTVVSPNETELARITGMPTDTEAQIGAAAGLLFSKGIETVLVKLGAKGSLLLRGAEVRPPVRQAAVPVDKVLDTTGAGDCYTAAWAVGCLDGLPAEDAMLFASAAAAICVQGMGATTSLPSRPEVDALYASLKA